MDDFFRLEELAFTYPQDGHGLPPVSLSVAPGEAVFVAGPSGCGKSTLARCMVGLIPHLYHGHLTGKALVKGQCTETTPLWQLTEQAGMVFQNPASQLLAPSVEEEIIFGLENLGLPPHLIAKGLRQSAPVRAGSAARAQTADAFQRRAAKAGAGLYAGAPTPGSGIG